MRNWNNRMISRSVSIIHLKELLSVLQIYYGNTLCKVLGSNEPQTRVDCHSDDSKVASLYIISDFTYLYLCKCLHKYKMCVLPRIKVVNENKWHILNLQDNKQTPANDCEGYCNVLTRQYQEIRREASFLNLYIPVSWLILPNAIHLL